MRSAQLVNLQAGKYLLDEGECVSVLWDQQIRIDSFWVLSGLLLNTYHPMFDKHFSIRKVRGMSLISGVEVRLNMTCCVCFQGHP